ncbi:phage holin family protein [Sesbania bispinosa]|nr:phage holin family protein [Sesbania bispinosa]
MGKRLLWKRYHCDSERMEMELKVLVADKVERQKSSSVASPSAEKFLVPAKVVLPHKISPAVFLISVFCSKNLDKSCNLSR